MPRLPSAWIEGHVTSFVDNPDRRLTRLTPTYTTRNLLPLPDSLEPKESSDVEFDTCT
eukprot:m.92365 g.92365  ORF g.92365 m.92365 type:complete len:58 (-) comp12034_c0_seq2:2568-2741(-)